MAMWTTPHLTLIIFWTLPPLLVEPWLLSIALGFLEASLWRTELAEEVKWLSGPCPFFCCGIVLVSLICSDGYWDCASVSCFQSWLVGTMLVSLVCSDDCCDCASVSCLLWWLLGLC